MSKIFIISLIFALPSFALLPVYNPSYNEIDVAFKKLNITSHNINESIPSSDEILLFKPKIL